MRRGLWLVDRDYEVIKFIYDMKFSCTNDVFGAFFDDGKVKNNRYCYNRLKKMEAEGFIKSNTVSTFNTRWYIIAGKGLSLLRERFTDDLYPKKAADKIDTRYFEHDRTVALCRIALEHKGLAKNWVSEKSIAYSILTKTGEYQSKYMFQNLRQSSIPDGLFETKKGEKVAFELEFSRKSNRALMQKLNNLHQETKSKNAIFNRVLVITNGDKIYNLVTKTAKDLGASFKVLRLNNVINGGQK